MLKRISPLIIIAFLCLNCMSAMVSSGISSAIESTAIGGDFLIQNNPQVGDYAVYKRITQSSTAAGGYKIDVYALHTDRYEVTSVNDNGIIVRMENNGEYVETKVNGQISKKSTKEELANEIGTVVMEYHLDKKGTITEVLYKNDRFGVTTRFKKAAPGQEGYIHYTEGNQNIDIKTDAGTFRSRPVFYSTRTSTQSVNRYTSTNVASVNYNITYINPAVKFKKVTSLTTSIADVNSSIDTAKMVNDITSVLSLTSFVTNPSSIVSGAKSILDFARNNPLPGKESILKAAAQDYEVSLRGVQGSVVEYLVEQGHKKGI